MSGVFTPRGQEASSVIDLIGRTPLLRLRGFAQKIPTSRFREGRVPEPRRVGEGSRRRRDLATRSAGTAATWKTILDATSGTPESPTR